MCGGSEKDLYDPRRIGALAVVSDRSGLEQDLSGRIMFFNDVDSKSTLATHVKFIPTQGQQIRQQLLLEVGGDGVIGRRIAISSQGPSKTCMAEGIVGFNSGSIALAA
ncbi:hypothetical protein SLS63_011767 [Diaporthe eres]|uniref:Uncharacterized protein n=1 Tax=Diaporthe eres TaxID=83184 RepID=A0ABR1NT89_DIAER